MKNWFEHIKEKGLQADVINLIEGIILVAAIIAFCIFPGNKWAIGIMILMAGIMNITNGIRKYREASSRIIGMVLLAMGVLVFGCGAYLLIML